MGHVVMGRNRHGSQGRDIVIYDGVPAQRHDLYTGYVPNTREYRLHVFQGDVIRVQGKYHDYPNLQTTPYIKNHAQGYRFRAPNKELKPDRIEQSILAVQSLGLDFGAVDLLIGEDRNTYILEVNTAPSCSPLTATKYVEKFAAVLGIEPRPAMLEVLAVDNEE